MEWQFDKRIMERNLQKGLINQKDLEKRLKGLPDLTDQVAPIEAPAEESRREADDEE
jgi:hypothetical protein